MIQGSCHCGAVRWTFEGQPDGATACNCTVCRRYGVLWAYDYEGEGIKISGKTQPYVRGEGIEFHFCPVCGCVAFWRAQQKDPEGRNRTMDSLYSPKRDGRRTGPYDGHVMQSSAYTRARMSRVTQALPWLAAAAVFAAGVRRIQT